MEKFLESCVELICNHPKFKEVVTLMITEELSRGIRVHADDVDGFDGAIEGIVKEMDIEVSIR